MVADNVVEIVVVEEVHIGNGTQAVAPETSSVEGIDAVEKEVPLTEHGQQESVIDKQTHSLDFADDETGAIRMRNQQKADHTAVADTAVDEA